MINRHFFHKHNNRILRNWIQDNRQKQGTGEESNNRGDPKRLGMSRAHTSNGKRQQILPWFIQYPAVSRCRETLAGSIITIVSQRKKMPGLTRPQQRPEPHFPLCHCNITAMRVDCMQFIHSKFRNQRKRRNINQFFWLNMKSQQPAFIFDYISYMKNCFINLFVAHENCKKKQ